MDSENHIIRGKGETGLFEEKQHFYYVQLVYAHDGPRNAEHGNELKFFPVIGSREQGFMQAERDSSLYIAYRAKATYATGDGNERLPTNELLIKVPNGMSLDSLVMLQGKRVGARDEVSDAELGFTAKVFDNYSEKPPEINHTLREFTEELGLVIEQRPSSVTCRIPDQRRNKTMTGNDYLSDILVLGPVLEVVHVYDFLQKSLQRREFLEYKNLVMSFR